MLSSPKLRSSWYKKSYFLKLHEVFMYVLNFKHSFHSKKHNRKQFRQGEGVLPQPSPQNEPLKTHADQGYIMIKSFD